MTIVVPVAIPAAGLPLPDPTDRTTFSARKLEQIRWANAEYSTYSYNLGLASYSNALDAQGSATTAAASQVAAAASAASAAATAGVTVWVTGTTYAIGNNVYSPINFLTYRRKTAGAGSTDPSADPTNWALLLTGALPITPINSNTAASVGNTYLIYGTGTLTLPASSAVGSQVGVIVLAGVTGAIVDPNGGKIRNVSGAMSVDSTPFSSILTNSGAAYGWV